MNISKSKSVIMVLIAVLWLLCSFLGSNGQYIAGMCLGVVLMFLHMLLGISHDGIASKKFVFYPMVIWAALWIVSFILSQYFSAAFAGMIPTFTILGLHPSFGCTVFLYWIGGMLTINLGLYINKDEWLSQKQWDEFCKEARALKEAK